MSNKAVFLDRDNTLIDDPGYMNHPDQVHLLPGATEALAQLRRMGYRLVVVSNQSAVARGIVTENVLEQIHNRLRELLSKSHVFLDAIYYCPYHPEGVIDEFRKESDLRKPNPGMLLRAADEMNIDLDNSWMIGDSFRDVIAGKRAGCRTILINSPAKPAIRESADPLPDKEAVNIKEAANIIRMLDIKAAAVPMEKTVEPVPEKEEVQSTTENETEDLTMDLTDTPPKLRTVKPKPAPSTEQPDKMHRMLEDVLTHLKRHDREQMFEEFSIFKLASTVAQVVVFFCLLLSLWFLMDSTRPASSVHTAIGFAAVFQLMVVAFCLMEKRK